MNLRRVRGVFHQAQRRQRLCFEIYVKEPLKINAINAKTTFFTAPKVEKPETVHIILAVTDKGVPALTRYQRVIVTVYPE